MLKGFFSYRSRQKVLAARLVNELTNDALKIWFDQNIAPGDAWEERIMEALTSADVTAFLVTGMMRGDNYAIDIEYPIADERARLGQTVIVPLVYDPVLYELKGDLSKYNALPLGALSVSEVQDEAQWLKLVREGLSELCRSIRDRTPNPGARIIEALAKVRAAESAARAWIENITRSRSQRLLDADAVIRSLQAVLLSAPSELIVSTRLTKGLVDARIATKGASAAELGHFRAIQLALIELSNALTSARYNEPRREIEDLGYATRAHSDPDVIDVAHQIDAYHETLMELHDDVLREPSSDVTERTAVAVQQAAAHTRLLSATAGELTVDLNHLAEGAQNIERVNRRIENTVQAEAPLFGKATREGVLRARAGGRQLNEHIVMMSKGGPRTSRTARPARDPIEITVFSPKGDRYVLPSGAMGLDFAYAVHTAIGDTCDGVKINGEERPLSRVLREFDVVEILRRETPAPVLGWQSLAVTTRARAAQRRLNHIGRQLEFTRLGRELVEHAFYRMQATLNVETLAFVARRLSRRDLDDLYHGVGAGDIKPRDVVLEAHPELKEEMHRFDDRRRLDYDKARLYIKGGGLKSGERLEPCAHCTPIVGDRIIGLRTNDIVTVHAIDCGTLEKAPDAPEWLDLAWTGTAEERTISPLTVFIDLHDERALKAILHLCARLEIGIDSVSVTSSRSVATHLRVLVRDARHAATLIAEIRAVAGVRDVERHRGGQPAPRPAAANETVLRLTALPRLMLPFELLEALSATHASLSELVVRAIDDRRVEIELVYLGGDSAMVSSRLQAIPFTRLV